VRLCFPLSLSLSLSRAALTSSSPSSAAKFLNMGLETSWRGDVAALTYIETSTWTRQEHNGFSHQQPGFVSTVLSLPPKLARV